MMEINALPAYNMSDNPTGCCPRFTPTGWDEQRLFFRKKPFLKATTRSIFHIPLNMGSVYSKTLADITAANALSEADFIVLSWDPSAWTGEHYFSVTSTVFGHEMLEITGDFLTKVFEGPYKHVPKWEREMEAFVNGKGNQVKKTYFFYTTCPKCAKYYQKNYVVAVSEIQYGQSREQNPAELIRRQPVAAEQV